MTAREKLDAYIEKVMAFEEFICPDKVREEVAALLDALEAEAGTVYTTDREPGQFFWTLAEARYEANGWGTVYRHTRDGRREVVE